MKTPFHLSLPFIDITLTKDFYINNIGATIGRQTEKWFDINSLLFLIFIKFLIEVPNLKNN